MPLALALGLGVAVALGHGSYYTSPICPCSRVVKGQSTVLW